MTPSRADATRGSVRVLQHRVRRCVASGGPVPTLPLATSEFRCVGEGLRHREALFGEGEFEQSLCQVHTDRRSIHGGLFLFH
jgi:hypothetical protein